MDLPAAPPTGDLRTDSPQGRPFAPFGDDGFTFLDVLDVINPLQHIPIVSTVYRALTGDEISPGAKVAGGTLFGGPIGAATSLVDVAVEEGTGKDLGSHMLAMLQGDAAEAPAGGPVATDTAALDAARFETAAGPTPDDDPVMAWARRERAFRTAGADTADVAVPAAPSRPADRLAEARTPIPGEAAPDVFAGLRAAALPEPTLPAPTRGRGVPGALAAASPPPELPAAPSAPAPDSGLRAPDAFAALRGPDPAAAPLPVAAPAAATAASRPAEAPGAAHDAWFAQVIDHGLRSYRQAASATAPRPQRDG